MDIIIFVSFFFFSNFFKNFFLFFHKYFLLSLFFTKNVALDYLYIVEDFCGVGDFAMFRGLGLKWSERVLCKIAKDVLNGLLFLHKTVNFIVIF